MDVIDHVKERATKERAAPLTYAKTYQGKGKGRDNGRVGRIDSP